MANDMCVYVALLIPSPCAGLCYVCMHFYF